MKFVTVNSDETYLQSGLPQSAAVKEGLFDQLSWFYALCRKYAFQDDTESIVGILVSFGLKLNGAQLAELGCGPGFYATRIAQRFRLLDVIGIDRSPKLLEHSRARAKLLNLRNCCFLEARVESLPLWDDSIDAVISSRLLMVLPDPRAALREIFRVSKPGGLFFLAEPHRSFRAKVPWIAMQGIALVMRTLRKARADDHGESVPFNVLSTAELAELLKANPWHRVVTWETRNYQYAVCAKPEKTRQNRKPAPADDYII